MDAKPKKKIVVLILEDTGDLYVPLTCRLKRLLKNCWRGYGLRCVDYSLPADDTPTLTPQARAEAYKEIYPKAFAPIGGAA